MMRVCIVSNLFYPYLGGAEFHFLNLARQLIALGCDVSLVTLKGKSEHRTTEVFQGVHIFRVRNIFGLYSLLKKERWRVVHSSMSRKVFSYAGIVFGHWLGAVTLFTPHCFYPPRNTLNRLVKYVFDHTIGFLTFQSLDVMINSTVIDQQEALRLGLNPSKSVIIPNSIVCSEIDDLAATPTPDFDKKYAIPGAFLLFVGRIDYVKNIDYIIRCLPLINKSLSLVIIGQDEGYKEELQGLTVDLKVENRVIWIEKAPFRDVITAYSRCRALLLPSSMEGLPTVVLEAMLLQKVAIIADSGGCKTVISNAIDGFLFNVKDYHSAIPSIVNRLDALDTLTIGRLAREKVLAKYCWEKNAVAVLDVYTKLLADRITQVG